MKILSLIFSLRAFCSSLPGQTTLTGTVTDAAGQPLEFATVAVRGRADGTLSTTDGSFALTPQSPLAAGDTIVFSYLGYRTRSLAAEELTPGTRVTLAESGVALVTVDVTAGKLRAVQLGRKEKKALVFYQHRNRQTYQIATRVRNRKRRTGVLTELRYYFGAAARRGKPVRLNFYALDPACECPGTPLHGRSIVPDGVRKGWNKEDLRDHGVELPGGDFFVAYEWLDGERGPGALDFSVGCAYDGSSPPVFEKTGGLDWQVMERIGKLRPLIKLTALVD